MNQLRVDLAACQRQVTHRQGVNQEGRLGLFFGHVDLIVSGRVKNDFCVVIGQRILYRGVIGDVHLGAIPGDYGVTPLLEFADQLHTQLAGGSENYRASAHRNTTIPQRETEGSSEG